MKNKFKQILIYILHYTLECISFGLIIFGFSYLLIDTIYEFTDGKFGENCIPSTGLFIAFIIAILFAMISFKLLITKDIRKLIDDDWED